MTCLSMDIIIVCGGYDEADEAEEAEEEEEYAEDERCRG